MKTATPTDTIDVQALRVGMFVHLDGGWMSHPFPLSNFRITSPAQLATIRSLGLRRVRWSPQQSDMLVDEAPAPVASVVAAQDAGHVESDPEDTVPQVVLAEETTIARRARGRARPAARARQKQLDRQRESTECCERQYAEAARDCRRASTSS